MAPSANLIIKNISKKMSREDQIKFFKNCGALDVKIVSFSGKKCGKAFARFENENIAERALYHLHQQEVMGYNLVVEFAKNEPLWQDYSNIPTNITSVKESESEILYRKFKEKMDSWCAGINFFEPVPHQLRYQYPPPTHATLSNISRALISCPKLYTQVLHLMNKMNLPCPISLDVPLKTSIPTPQPDKAEPLHKTESETESELSGEEAQQRETIPNIKSKEKKIVKRSKIIKSIKPAPTVKTKKIKYKDVFEDPKSLLEVPKKKMKPLSENLPGKSLGEDNIEFGFIHPVADIRMETIEEVKPLPLRNEMEEERLEKEAPPDAISLKELAANRLPERDRIVLPVFKNYVEGAPTCRLYIKNLSKQTTEKDLRFIYSAFWTEPVGDSPNMFDVRLMQEGRMKGQAFVTLQSVELAKKALIETNGYILNDKPMVVQFARSATK